MMFGTPDPSQSAMPLKSLSAIALDTETTGLDTAADRIVQIGAVRLVAGRIDRGDRFDQLVNPGTPIPERSTKIHGISDTDVAKADEFAAVMPGLAAWAGGSVILGYAIGFDLAVLKAEHGRAGLAWKPPRCLDVGHLVQLLSPNLPSTALDPVAAWLGIDVRNRHQALGDALLAADIYLAILPKLRAKGIFTLAEAERACLALTSRIDEEARAGWHGVVTSTRQRATADGSIHARIDSFPYRHRLRQVMQSPPVMAGNDVAVGKALGLMMERQVSSVFLPPLDEGGACGILTERDVLRAVDGAGADALKEPVSRYSTRPLITLDQDEFVYRAISRMAAEGFR
ncbi:MAG: exonuclease domain-containing protein, partial [Geminicoccaceae bacterium]